MYLIDKTYFRNKLEIQGLHDSNNGISEKLEDYIELYVIDFLQKLLGVEDFEDLNANILRGNLKENAPQRWLDLINGVTYINGGLTKKWKGLIYKQGSVKCSILANIVFVKLFSDLETNNGKFSIDVKSSIKNLPKTNFLEAWNEIAEHFLGVVYNNPTITFKGDVRFVDYFGINNNQFVTLSQYLIDKQDDFTNINFDLGYDVKNSFDI